MHQAEMLFREGELDGALAELKRVLCNEPASAPDRAFYFQLLCVLGDWERAKDQLAILRELDPAWIPLAHACEAALGCELLRRDVFSGTAAPTVFGEPPPLIAYLIESLKYSETTDLGAAELLRSKAFNLAPGTSGTLVCEGRDAVNFEWIGDADTRLGPVLEVIIDGRYFWVPFDRIAWIGIAPPTELRELVWLSARFRWTNGGEAVGWIPTRYYGTESCADSQLKLARRTDWRSPTENSCFGVGQRVFATDQGDHSILDVRQITLDHVSV